MRLYTALAHERIVSSHVFHDCRLELQRLLVFRTAQRDLTPRARKQPRQAREVCLRDDARVARVVELSVRVEDRELLLECVHEGVLLVSVDEDVVGRHAYLVYIYKYNV